MLLAVYGEEEMDRLLSHYGTDHTDEYKGVTSHQSADLNPDKVRAEWGDFKEIMFERRRLFQNSLDRKIAKETKLEAITSLIQQRKEYTPANLFNDISTDQICNDLHPGCIYLLKLSLMFPLSVACVERSFSKMKLIKTRLRNQLGQSSLDSLLRISTESPQHFQDNEYELFVDELNRLNPKLRIKL